MHYEDDIEKTARQAERDRDSELAAEWICIG